MDTKLLHGDCREVLKSLPDQSVNCCVTSPPYFGLRDYGVDGQIGLEPTPESYIAELLTVFREVKRVLRDDGTLWLNIGDSYSSGGRTTTTTQTLRGDCSEEAVKQTNKRPPVIDGIKPKDLIGIPWMLAFALRKDGWYLRQDIIWHKPNPMPESVTDRCTKAHEYVFLLSKSEQYYFDQDEIMEKVAQSSIDRLSQNNLFRQAGSNRVPGKTNGNMKAVGSRELRNKRSVWTINTRPYREAHFATFPPALIAPMIVAGCQSGGIVLDPFGGSGTTGEVAESLGRNSILIELNPKYIEIQERRTAQQGLAL